MKYHLIALTLLAACMAPAQDLKTLTPITGANISDSDYLPLIDVSANGLKGATIPEIGKKLEASLAGSINVKNYGAVGNGATDDSSAFQTAINAAAAAGKRLYVPMTTPASAGYVVGNLTIPQGSSIFGDGPNHGSDWTGALPANVTILKALAGAAHIFKTNTAVVPNEGFKFANLDIRGGNGTSTLTTYGVWFAVNPPDTYAGEVMEFDNVTLRGFVYGLKNEGGVHVSFRNCTLSQNRFGAHFSGATHTFEIVGCNLGGRPVDGTNGVGVYVDDSATIGSIRHCEIGNMSHGLEIGGTISIQGCNFESFDRRYAVLIRDVGVVTFISCSYAGASIGLVDAAVGGATNGAFVRNNNGYGNILNRTTFIGCHARDGSVYYDGELLWYETKQPGDRPTFISQPGSGRLMNSAWTVVKERFSARDVLAASRPVITQRVDLAAAPVSGSGYASANSGSATLTGAGLALVSHTSANSSVVSNLSKSFVFNPIIARPGDAFMATVDWSRRIGFRFKIAYFDQSGTPTTDDKFVMRIGDFYNSTATGDLTGRGVGILVEGTSVKVIAHNGTAQTSAVIGTLADATLAEIVITSDGAGNVFAGMTGNDQVVLTGGPTTEGASHANSITLAAWNTATSAAAPCRSIRDLEISYY